MQFADSTPTLLPEAQNASSLAETTLLDDIGRERKILLTSLLFTSALVAFAIAHLPQILPLSSFGISPQRTTTQTQTLNVTIDPSAERKTLVLDLPASDDRYTLQVIVQLNQKQVSRVQPSQTSVKPIANLAAVQE